MVLLNRLLLLNLDGFFLPTWKLKNMQYLLLAIRNTFNDHEMHIQQIQCSIRIALKL